MGSTIWKGRLNFGLVSIPIKLSRAARAEKIHMHRLDRETGRRVRQVFVPAAAGEERPEPQPETPAAADAPEPATQVVEEPERPAPLHVPAPESPAQGLSRKDMVTGFEFEKGRYVEFAPEELEQMAPKNSADLEIVEFVSFEEVDPVYLETSYYVAPDAGGNKPYALLLEALRKSGYAAIGQFVMHRRDQIMILRPGKHGLIGHTMFYQDEVRSQDEYHAEAGLAVEKELALALKLVEALAGSFQPDKFKDLYRERLQAAIAKKVENQPAVARAGTGPTSGVVDIMAALQESLAKARKPVARESRRSGEKKTKRVSGR